MFVSFQKSHIKILIPNVTIFPGVSDSKESTCNAGNLGSIPGLGRSPGGGNDNPLQYSCLENPTDREVWWATVHGVTKSQTRSSGFHTQHFLSTCMNNTRIRIS